MEPLPAYACDTQEYMFNGTIGELKKIVYEKILSPIIPDSSIAHVGCDITAILWGLTYIHTAQKIGRFDINEQYITYLRRQLNTLSLDNFSETYGYFVDFIEQSGNTTDQYTTYYTKLISSDIEIAKRDFCSSNIPTKNLYNEIICIESIEAVDTTKELITVLTNLKKILAPNGIIRCLSLLYPEKNNNVTTKHNFKLEGFLNPDHNTFISCAQEAGLSTTFHESITLHHVPGYNTADVYYFS